MQCSWLQQVTDIVISFPCFFLSHNIQIQKHSVFYCQALIGQFLGDLQGNVQIWVGIETEPLPICSWDGNCLSLIISDMWLEEFTMCQYVHCHGSTVHLQCFFMFIFSYCFILITFKVDPGSTGHGAGVRYGWDTSPLQDTMNTFSSYLESGLALEWEKHGSTDSVFKTVTIVEGKTLDSSLPKWSTFWHVVDKEVPPTNFWTFENRSQKSCSGWKCCEHSTMKM